MVISSKVYEMYENNLYTNDVSYVNVVNLEIIPFIYMRGRDELDLKIIIFQKIYR